eukprot:7430584-Pyramimonas_sp.AAC.1
MAAPGERTIFQEHLEEPILNYTQGAPEGPRGSKRPQVAPKSPNRPQDPQHALGEPRRHQDAPGRASFPLLLLLVV